MALREQNTEDQLDSVRKAKSSSEIRESQSLSKIYCDLNVQLLNRSNKTDRNI